MNSAERNVVSSLEAVLGVETLRANATKVMRIAMPKRIAARCFAMVSSVSFWAGVTAEGRGRDRNSSR